MSGITTEIVAAIADAEGVEPSELDYRLYAYIDPDAIEQLAAGPDTEWTLTFSVPGYEVTVVDTGRVLVDERRVEQPA